MLIIGNSVFTISHQRQGSEKVKEENTVHGLALKVVSTKLPLRKSAYCSKEAIQYTVRPT